MRAGAKDPLRCTMPALSEGGPSLPPAP
ncbi:MAG: hypothetical protein QOJ98_3512, partial [Acidobacteriota bacterium]|nr:hypothetical protein [Acidobacteriota bacterium]